MTIEELYRKIKAQVRQLGLRQSLYVGWAYSQYLQIRDFELPRDIEVDSRFLNATPPQTMLAEWTIEQIVREAIRYADEEPKRGKSLIQWKTLADIANAMRDLEGEIYRTLVGGNHIHLELMRISHRQFVWQQYKFGWRLIIRFYKLFNTPEIVAHALEATGLTIDEIFLIGMCYIGIFTSHPRATKALNVEVPGLTQAHVDRFLAFASRTRNELSAKLRTEHTLDEGFAYRYSSLREFPLVAISYKGQEEIACPVPTLLFWRITTGLYYSLKDIRGFSSAFGHSFEQYVGEVLGLRITNPGMSVLQEEPYQVGRNRKDTVDWIVTQNDEAALFLECKTMRLTWNSKAGLADLTALEQDIRKLGGAVLQVYKAIRDHRSGHYPQLPYLEARRIYPTIVTLEDWYMFGFDLPVRLDAAVRTAMEAADLPLSWLEDMPYSIISVHDLEKAAGVINVTGVQPFMSEKTLNPEFRRWAFGAYASERHREAVAELTHLFRDEFDEMFSHLPRN